MVSRGEVWWAGPLGEARRPFLVVTRDAVIPHVNAVLGIPASRTIRGHRSEVLLDADDGMPADCAVNADRLTLVAHERLETRICTLTPPRMRGVCRAIRVATGCD